MLHFLLQTAPFSCLPANYHVYLEMLFPCSRYAAMPLCLFWPVMLAYY